MFFMIKLQQMLFHFFDYLLLFHSFKYCNCLWCWYWVAVEAAVFAVVTAFAEKKLLLLLLLVFSRDTVFAVVTAAVVPKKSVLTSAEVV